ncbi:MAG: hypothetical protein NXI20_24230 [bacterium]|nr:hypothetical protein [bacterium]
MKTLKLLLTFIALMISFLTFAGPGGPPATPIDGGLGILLAGGALYGIKQLRRKEK